MAYLLAEIYPVPRTQIRTGIGTSQSPKTALSSRQSGESLVGLLVGMAVGMVVLAAGARMLATHLQGHRWILQDSHLHHDLRSALDTVASALRQAQFVGQAALERMAGSCADAFCGGQARLTLQAQRIDFGRDRNGNSLLDNNDCAGFRLSAHKLQMRTACLPEVWTDLTDAGSLKILDLQWQLHCELRGPWVARWVNVQLLAQWPQDPARQLLLSHTVALRNHVPATPWSPDCGPAP